MDEFLKLFRKKQGFTLVELAIVLVLIGLLVGLGTGLFGILIKQAKRKQTLEYVNAAVESVIGYAQTYKCLPDNNTFFRIVRRSTDAYNKPLRYVYAEVLGCSSGGYCGRKSTPLRIVICHNPACSSNSTVRDVAFLVLSNGANYNLQTKLPDLPSVSGNYTVRIYNYGLKVDDESSDGDRSSEGYDDVVKWVTVFELMQKAECKPLRIDSPQILPEGVSGTYYYYKFEVEGGRPPYRWELVNGDTGGLTLKEDSGVLYGIINASFDDGECSKELAFTVAVYDSANNTSEKDFSILVRPKPLKIVTEHLPYGYENSEYDVKLYAEGGTGSYLWSCNNTDCSGLICHRDGEIKWENPHKGTCYVDVLVSDGCSVDSRRFSITINPVFYGNGTDNGSSGGGGRCCPNGKVCVYNFCGYQFYIDGCENKWKYGSRISLEEGDEVAIYWGIQTPVSRICIGIVDRISFSDAESVDKNGNGCVDYVAAGAGCMLRDR